MRGLLVKAGLVAILIAVIVVGYNGCGGKSSSGSSEVAKLTVTGVVGSGYIVSAPENILDKFCSIFTPMKAWAGLSDGDVDQIIAMPYEGGYLGEYTILESISFPINPDNSFSLSLEKDRNWVLILVDSSVTGREKFVGYVAMKMDADESTLLLPASSATASSLDIGTISQSVTDTTLALTEDALTTTAFSLNQSQLLDLAKNDDLLKIIKNLYFNYQNGVYWNLRPDYKWSGDYDAISGTGFPNPSTHVFDGGYAFQLDSNFHGIGVQEFIGPPSATFKALLELYPPATVDGLVGGFGGGGSIYDASTPISNANVNLATAGPTAGGEWEAWSNDFFAGERGSDISYSTTSFTGTVPAGFWKFGMTNTTTSALLASAEFDVEVASPITGTIIKGFVPSIKVNVDGSKRITSVDIKWYAWNGADYVEITDTSALKSLVGRFDFGIENFTDPNPRKSESVDYDVTVTNVIPQGIPAGNPWYYGNSGEVTESDRAESIMVFYSSGGIGYYFFWSNWDF